MGEQLRFKVLGPLAVTAGEASVPLGGARQRAILALLLVTPGRVVPVDTMVDTVWNSNPPPTSRTQVAICVAALRKIFKSAGATDDVIVTSHPGYVLNTESHRFDSLDFTDLVQTAEQCAKEGRLPEAAQNYAQALDLWRGPAFSGVSGQLIEDEAARLEEHRLNAYDDSTLVHLELGQHQELIPELAAMVREHPLRERIRHHLMLAQYRSGRRADAMETYRDARTQFIDELGIEPGPDLNELHDAILRDDPSLAPVAPTVERRPAQQAQAQAPAPALAVPSELPPDVPAFTGRTEELAALESLVSSEAEDRGSTIGLITGAAGIGKSGLAMRWAFRAVEHFPDGQLFADLRGYDEHHEPVSAHDVLSRFLRSLGVPGEQVPTDLEERVSLYRSLLTDRRVLIVLDNARTYAQVRPLLPGGGQSCVLVTSRDQMEELVTWPSQARVHLGLLSEPEAVELLTAIVGERRIATVRADAARLVELCDRLPLALRIAAARLASKPHWTVRYLVTRLSDERRRLDELSQGESQVRASLALSYRYLPEEAARLFRRLGLLDVPDFTAWVGAALLNKEALDAERLIEDLVDAQFLEVVSIDPTGQLRYRFHGLVRLYARERARQEESEPDRLAASTRFLRTFLTIAEEADRRENAGSGTGVHSGVQRRRIDSGLLDELLAVPLEWYEAERLALVASVRQAARMGQAELAWDLTVCASIFFGTRNYSEDCRRCCEDALEAARAAGDLRGQGAMRYLLGSLELGHSRLETGIEHFEEALRLYEEAQEDHGKAMAMRSIGTSERMRGELDSAMERFSEALPIFRDVGDRYCEAHTLHNMAETELDRGRPESAMQFAVDAVRIAERDTDSTRVLAQAVHRLGRVHLALGQLPAAEEAFLRAVRIVKEKSDMIGLAHALLGLGETRLGKGDAEAAETTLADALDIAEDCRIPLVAGQISLVLGDVSSRLGRVEAARRHLRAAQEKFAVVGASALEQRAEQALGALVG
ncbi:tetratricopeptide repeat protein [Streptomyces montanus]|uniref:Tetratricopeptide repeat protein n=1 Tax=Streptomyces montanus TaxID=2580423 RepID=A0A5R9FMD7_9ACTN|nr:BTAD domain-containing putative transcriptional regulator [Streptomyces montanus]TLS43120.1 tetratricopeptide repeat protein [Streptomyces montanus]